SGMISGAVQITKEDGGQLTLTNANNSFTGNFTIDPNGGVIQVTNSNALGVGTGTTTVLANAQLQLAPPAASTLTITESLILNGNGIANDGALRNISNGNTWAGTIQLAGNSIIGANAGSVLDVTGVISDLGGQNLTKELGGRLNLDAANTYNGQTIINGGIVG